MNHSVRPSDTKRKKLIIEIAITFGILLIPGCGIPELRKPEPGIPLPETFFGGNSTENSSQVPRIEFFTDPILTCLIDQALVGNLELKILAQDIRIANNETYSRSGAFLPFLSLAAGAGIEKPSLYTPLGAVENQLLVTPGQHFPNPLPNFLVASNLSWQIDIWRALHNAKDAAALRYLGTIEGRNYVVTRLVAEIAENYYELIALDRRLDNLNQIIALQEQSLKTAQFLKDNARGSELGVQRFLAEVRKNQSEKLIVRQDIIETENRINFLTGRFPQPVERNSAMTIESYLDLSLHALDVGIPSQLLQFRPDIRQAERELAANGLDVKVARAQFLPALVITGGVGYEAFNPRYLAITPEALIGNIAGGLVAPLINRRAIKADYLNANARQLQSIINYQRVILNAFTEVINRVNMEQNYRNSIAIKQQQLTALNASVAAASNLFQNANGEYLDVLLAQQALFDARRTLIETKQQQLSAIVTTYQALGGGLVRNPEAAPPLPPLPPEAATGAAPAPLPVMLPDPPMPPASPIPTPATPLQPLP